MSESLDLTDEIRSICRKAGLEVKSVRAVNFTPTSVVFEVFADQMGALPDGATEGILVVTFPFRYTP